MSRKFKQIALSALLASSVTLSGCAQMMNFGDMAWTGTKNFTVNSGKKVASLLRPRAEREEPVFVFNERGQHANTAQPTVSDPYVTPSTYPSLPATAYGTSESQSYSSQAYTSSAYTPDYGYQPYNSGQYDSIELAGHSTGQTYYYGPQSQQPEEPQQDYAYNSYSSPMPDLSYVKISGQTSITDWQSCQAQAGGYIEPDGNGFKIRSDFDYCMRVNGYMPEREAIQFMDAQTLP